MQMEVDYVKIAQRVRKLRLAKGLTQADLSAMVNGSNNYLSHIETAQCKLSRSKLLRLSCTLGESTDYLRIIFYWTRPMREKTRLSAAILRQSWKNAAR